MGGCEFSSRLFLGTGKFSSNALMGEAIAASGTEMVTVAMKRIELSDKEDDMLGHIKGENVRLLPNTSGVRDAEEAVQSVFVNLEKVYNHPNDINGRQEMMLAAFKAGFAFTRSSVGNVHAMGHAMGAKYNTPHGLAMAVILPHMLDFYGEKIYKKLAKLADVVGITGADEAEKAKAFIKAVKDMNAYMQ